MVPLEQFIEGLKISRLLSASEVDAILVSLPPDLQPPDVQQLVGELLRRGKLTKYQAGRIVSGRPRGLVLGKYTIQDKIGEGGMGEVFIAEHRRMKRPVVVKILPASATKSKQSIRRFQREVEAAARLHHPNIVTAFDADEEDGIHFLVMEHVQGEPLGELVTRTGPLAIETAISYILQAAQGLEYAHSKGIVHRDIKPNNLLVDSAGTVKILDMGLARFDDSSRSTVVDGGDSLTGHNQIVGTIEYMSPEQVDDSSKVDGRSDIYSLGCTLFRLLTDRAPFVSDSVVKTLLAHRVEPIPSVNAIRPECPASLDALLSRMMAKVPEDRYQSAGELAEDLRSCLKQAQRTRAKSGTAVRPDSDTKTMDSLSEEDAAAALSERTVDSHRSEDTRVESAAVDVGALQDAQSIAELLGAPAVGIDLGTTFSAIAALDDVGRPQVLANLEGDKTTPSVVLLDGDDIIVGKEAAKAMATDMDHIADCAKRDLGSVSYRHKIHGRELPPEVIEAWILSKLKKDAENVLGKFKHAVITVPAYFDEVRRKATQDAGYLAGLDVLDIINEPTAAALAFGFLKGHLDLHATGDAKRVLVYDLGGGTFDVTIMEIANAEFVTLCTDGDVQLGGRDWDQRLVDHVAEVFHGRHAVDPREDPNTYGKLLRECEDAKRTLSARQKAHVTCDYRGFAERIEVTRDEFEQLTVDLLERTSFTTRQTLAASGLSWEQIDHILLVGGSTRMPSVVRMIRDMSGREPEATLSPDEAVAQGAAIHAGLLLERLAGKPPRVRVSNVNSHSLGVVATDRRTEQKRTAVLIPRNTPLPTKAKRVFKTLKKGQKSIVAVIVEGESDNPLDCMQIGKCVVRDLPDDLPAGTRIEVQFHYTDNGRLQVVVDVDGADREHSLEISRVNNLSPADLSHWRTIIASQALP